MTNEEIAKGMFERLKDGRCIGIYANQGVIPSFTILFENGKEERSNFTFQPALQTQINNGMAEIRAKIEINVSDWRK